jgi:hypothetical protein
VTDFDRDPAALAWARNHIQNYLDRLTEFEATANKNRNAVMAYSCGVARELTQKHFLGNGLNIIGILDERHANPPAHDGGPTIAEAAAHDRAWWDGQKTGEQ